MACNFQNFHYVFLFDFLYILKWEGTFAGISCAYCGDGETQVRQFSDLTKGTDESVNGPWCPTVKIQSFIKVTFAQANSSISLCCSALRPLAPNIPASGL